MLCHKACHGLHCRSLTREDWETNLLPIVQEAKYPELTSAALTLDLFNVAASWVSSRAFGVDSYHGKLCTRIAAFLGQVLSINQSISFCVLGANRGPTYSQTVQSTFKQPLIVFDVCNRASTFGTSSLLLSSCTCESHMCHMHLRCLMRVWQWYLTGMRSAMKRA